MAIIAKELGLVRDANRALGRLEVGCELPESQADLATLGRVIDAYTELLLPADESEHVRVGRHVKEVEELGELIMTAQRDQRYAEVAPSPQPSPPGAHLVSDIG